MKTQGIKTNSTETLANNYLTPHTKLLLSLCSSPPEIPDLSLCEHEWNWVWLSGKNKREMCPLQAPAHNTQRRAWHWTYGGVRPAPNSYDTSGRRSKLSANSRWTLDIAPPDLVEKSKEKGPEVVEVMDGDTVCENIHVRRAIHCFWVSCDGKVCL